MNIGDIFFMLRGDGGPLQVDAEKAAQAAATTGSKTFSQTMGASLKKAAGGMAGAAVGAAFGMMAKGAVELDAATRQLQADAGLTAEEAKKAQSALAGMYRGNLQGFMEISSVMAKVHNDLGLVGKEADKVSAQFLKFATATGQEAGGAVASFDDILDTWGMTAKDAGSVMDKLIASHQKYGGSIQDNQASLAALGPSMRAANMEMDDAIALLNLFGAKGIDANTASAAFAKSLTKVKSPEELQGLIADISATEDPFLRAEKAAGLFGARAGAKLANALAGVNLDDYKIDMQEAAGATTDAANAIESGFGAKFKMLLKNAQGALAELGTGMGDLMVVAAMLGPKLTSVIGAGIGTLTTVLIPKLTAAIMATGPATALASSTIGTAAGTAFSTAMAAGIAAAPFILAGAIGAALGGAIGMAIEGPVVEAAKKDMGAKVDQALADAASMADLEHMKEVIQKGMDDMPTLLGWDIFGGRDALQAKMDDVDAEIERRASGIPEAAAEGIESGTPELEVAVKQMVSTFGTSMTGVRRAAKIAGAEGMQEMAKGILSARQAPLDAFDTLTQMLKNAMTPIAEVARLKGQLTSKALAAGLKSGDPAVRAQAIAVAKIAADRLGELAVQGGAAGRKAMTQLNAGIKSKIPEVRAAALAAKEAAQAKLDALKGSARTAGTAAGTAFSTALQNAGSSGFNIANGFVVRTTLSAPGRALGGSVQAGMPYVVGEYRPELFVPTVPGRIEPRVPEPGVTGAGVTVNVYNPTPEPAGTSVQREMRKLAYMGVLG